MSDLTKQAGLLSATEFFRFFLKSLIGIALARLLSPAELGSYRQLFLIYATFSTLLLMGIPQSLLYFLPKSSGPQDQKRIISRTLNIVSLLAAVFAFLLLVVRHEVAIRFDNPQLSQLILIYALYPLFIFVTQLYSSVMLGLKQPSKAAGFTIFAILCDFILILGTAFLTRNLTYIVWAVIVSAFFQWLYSRIHLWRYNLPISRNSFDGLKPQLAYAIPLGLSSVIGMLSVQLDKLMISGFFTPEQFAVFSVGAMELPLIGILSNSVNAILLPNMSSSDRNNMADTYRAAVRKNALLMFPITALCFLFAKEIIVFLYSAVYADATIYFRIYLLILPLRIATYGIIFQAFGRTKIIMVNSIFMLSANVVLNYVLIKRFGMQGAAYATVIVTWLAVALYLILMKSTLQLHLRSFFPVRRILVTAVSVISASIPCYLMLMILGKSILVVVLAGLLFCILYLAFGRLTGVILSNDVALVRDMFHTAIRKLHR